MAEYENTNSGSLFENDRRVTEKHPHLKGSCTIKTPDGELVEYWVSAWQKTSRKGDDFFSLSFQLKEDEKETGEAPAKKPGGLFKKRDEPAEGKSSKQEELDDEIPFN
jgi:hypothetical protein